MVLRLVDFGLVVLIWITQLVVYPSFTYYSEDNLISWHAKYTTMISMIVMPLMLSQVVLHGLGIFFDFNWVRLLALALIVCAWYYTFLVAVPLHGKIGAGTDVLVQAHKLVAINWYRTIFWTVVAILGFIRPVKTESLFY